ncbi:MFS transporter [Ktedonospora formicarum]|uniref:MFS transporter n=1 Tax=Ktedonospora formicarum TaxID=2778364 RepID=A0A8J3HY45_9CHLR|nr:MFS transporter [Ktedonospora formicarum]GHO45336.1 MFS transporter [Ktedonospora formicarum]
MGTTLDEKFKKLSMPRRLLKQIGLSRQFSLLWTGQTISTFGSMITGTSMGLIAVLVLHALPFHLGILAFLEAVPVLVFGPLAGLIVDRVPRRPVLILVDIGRALLLALIPLAAWLGLLRIDLLYIVILLTATLSVFFVVAYQSFLPHLLPPEQILEGNSRLGLSDALAESVGPTLAGALITLIGAPVAIALDALSFLVSALSLGLMRVPEPERMRRMTSRRPWGDFLEGIEVIWREPVLRASALGGMLHNFCGGTFAALYTLFVVRELGITPLGLGLAISLGGCGAILGTMLTPWFVRRWGSGRVLIAGILLHACISIWTPWITGASWFVLAFLCASQFVGDIGYQAYALNMLSLRQRLVEERLQGRVHACMHVLNNGIAPLGALLAGALAQFIGVRLTLMLGIVGMLLATLCFLRRAIWRLR